MTYRPQQNSRLTSLTLWVPGVLLILLPGFGAANPQQQQADAVQGDATAVPTEIETETAPASRSGLLGFLGRGKARTETQGQRAVQWVDSFFSDVSYEAEVASTQFRVRPELYYRDQQGLKPKLKASFKFRLPNLEQHVSLFAGTSDFDSNFDQAVDDDISDPVIGLQFFGVETGKWHTSFSVGVKFDEFAGFIGPRVRYLTNWTQSTSFRFTQKILWQTNQEWQTRTRLDLNVAVNELYFFRQTIDGRWRGEYADEEGFRTRVGSFLTRRLGQAAGLQGEASVIFNTRPDTHVDEYVLALRYRKQAGADWLYYEIVPQVTWEHEFDYKLNPGIRLRFEIFFGTDKDTRYWRREAEDTDDFRW